MSEIGHYLPGAAFVGFGSAFLIGPVVVRARSKPAGAVSTKMTTGGQTYDFVDDSYKRRFNENYNRYLFVLGIAMIVVNVIGTGVVLGMDNDSLHAGLFTAYTTAGLMIVSEAWTCLRERSIKLDFSRSVLAFAVALNAMIFYGHASESMLSMDMSAPAPNATQIAFENARTPLHFVFVLLTVPCALFFLISQLLTVFKKERVATLFHLAAIGLFLDVGAWFFVNGKLLFGSGPLVTYDGMLSYSHASMMVCCTAVLLFVPAMMGHLWYPDATLVKYA